MCIHVVSPLRMDTTQTFKTTLSVDALEKHMEWIVGKIKETNHITSLLLWMRDFIDTRKSMCITHGVYSNKLVPDCIEACDACRNKIGDLCGLQDKYDALRHQLWVMSL